MKYLAILLTLLLFTSCGSSGDDASSGSGSGTNQPDDNWDEMKWDEGEWQ